MMTELIAKGFLAIVLRGEYQQVEPFEDQSVSQEPLNQTIEPFIIIFLLFFIFLINFIYKEQFYIYKHYLQCRYHYPTSLTSPFFLFLRYGLLLQKIQLLN